MDYTPIRISTIFPKRALSFELYIFFKEHFLKYIEVGRALEEEHLDKLKKQKIARFYIRDTDEGNYQNFLDEVLNQTIDDPSVEMGDKVNFAEGNACTAVEDMKKDPGSKQSYHNTKRAAKTLRKLIADNPDALKNFYGRKETAETDLLIKHCLNVSALVVGVAKVCDLGEDDQDALSIAGLLHDLGISRYNEEEQQLFLKVYKTMTLEEKKIYQQHPAMAAELLKKNPFVDPIIVDLILSHEEKISGEGYPEKKTKLTLPQEILSLCNCYDKRVTVLGMSPKDALKVVQVDELGNYNLELINKFKKQLKDNGIVI
ncbi:MAG: HD domain-containing protein [Oligoflexia bacterium]|nr:HD domain-containing protein [Oligoflexia bacterium]